MKNSKKISHISDLKVLFKPISITFHSHSNNTFKLYLHKNAQLLGQIQEIITPSNKQLVHRFSNELKPIQFRVVNEKVNFYQLAIYKVTNQEQQFVEDSEFTLSKYLNEYFKQFILFEEQLLSGLKEKQNQNFTSLWKQASTLISQRQYKSAVNFKNQKILVEFICQVINQYDQRNQQKKKTQSIKNQSIIHKSNSLKPKSSKQLNAFNHNSKQGLKQKSRTYNFELSKISELVERPQSTIQIGKLEIEDRQNQRNKNQHNSKYKFTEDEVSNFFQTKNQQGYQPTLYIRRERELIKSQSKTKLGTFQKEVIIASSNTQTNNLKTVIITILITIFYGLLIVHLLKPVSKISK